MFTSQVNKLLQFSKGEVMFIEICIFIFHERQLVCTADETMSAAGRGEFPTPDICGDLRTNP